MAWIVKRQLKRGPRYYVRYSLEGHVYWFAAGTSITTARKAKAKIETEIAEGRFLDRLEKSTWTLKRLSELYLPRMAELRPRSARWRGERMRQILRTLEPGTPIESITTETLDRYAEERLRAGKALSTVKGELAVLCHALRQAERWKEVGLSAYRLKAWSPPKGRDPREPVFLSADQVGRVLGTARARVARKIPGAGRAEVLMRLALATGARVGELCRISRQDLLPGRTLRLRASKGGLERAAPLDAELAGDLARLLQEDEQPFAGASIAKDRFRRFWRAVRKDARIPAVRFHDLRHTFASEFLLRGGTMRELQRRLGHRTGRMTERYAHFVQEREAPKAMTWAVVSNLVPGRDEKTAISGQIRASRGKASKPTKHPAGRPLLRPRA